MRDYTKIEAIRAERTGQGAMSEEQRGKRKDMGSEQRGDRQARRPHWRFKDLEIWQAAANLAVKFHRISEGLDARRLYRYAEQLRAAGLSLSNNIARPVK